MQEGVSPTSFWLSQEQRRVGCFCVHIKVSLGKFPIRNYPGSVQGSFSPVSTSINDDGCIFVGFRQVCYSLRQDVRDSKSFKNKSFELSYLCEH